MTEQVKELVKAVNFDGSEVNILKGDTTIEEIEYDVNQEVTILGKRMKRLYKTKYCKSCNAKLLVRYSRKRLKNRNTNYWYLERPSNYNARQFCNFKCSVDYRTIKGREEKIEEERKNAVINMFLYNKSGVSHETV